MNNNLEWMALVEGCLVSRWRGRTIKVVVRRKGGTSPTGKLGISSGLKGLMVWGGVIQLLAHNSFAVLSAVQSIATTFAAPVHW